MKHTFTIKTYQELYNLIDDLELRFCKKCGFKTWHLICGFDDNNLRWECLNHD